MADLHLENLTKVYRGRGGDVRAVCDLSLTVADREFVVLVGPSGCGKTTTLRLIAGLEEATSGAIRIGERIVNHVSPRDRNVAMVFQNDALYPHMTVYNNMAFGLKMRRIPKLRIKGRVAQTAERLGLTHLLHRKPGQLSGGECRRVALGRAIVRRPGLYLFDEPLSNLDATLRLTMRSEIKALQRNLQTTTVYVTHDQEEAMTIGDRLVVLRAGVIQQVDSPMNVYGRPANRFVASLIGSPPMNFLDGRLEQDGSKTSCVTEFGQFPIECNLLRLTGSERGSIVVGVRPEHLRIVDAIPCNARDGVSGSHVRLATATVEQTEPLGDRLTVRLSMPSGQAVTMTTAPSASFSTKQQVTLSVDVAHLHLFATTGDCKRLT